MTPKAKELNEDTRRNIIEITKVLDGHSIFSEGLFDEHPIPKELWEGLCVVHRSDPSSHKGTIYGDEGPIDELRGVYGLSLLWRIAEWLGADTKPAGMKMGRGFQAAELRAAIIEALGKNEHEVMG